MDKELLKQLEAVCQVEFEEADKAVKSKQSKIITINGIKSKYDNMNWGKLYHRCGFMAGMLFVNKLIKEGFTEADIFGKVQEAANEEKHESL